MSRGRIALEKGVHGPYKSNCKREGEKRGLAPWRNPVWHRDKRRRHGACPLFSDWKKDRVAPGGYPPGAPTDPNVRN